MDVETKSNGHQDSDKQNKRSIVVDTNGSSKDGPKQKRRRSRSRTPSLKIEDSKSSPVSLKKIEEDKNEKEETAKEDDSTRSTRSKTHKDKDESPKVDQDNKGEKAKKESSKKDEISSKKDKALQKDASKRAHNSSETKMESPTPKKKEAPSKKDDVVTPKKDIIKELASSAKDETHKKDNCEEKPNQQSKDTNGIDADSIEMDPLFIPDETEPELIFDENSDMESGKGSPIISRCITRRSLTRNIPTPKTPKSITDIESEQASTTTATTTDTEPIISANNDTDDASNNEHLDITNASLCAEVGSDVTRMEYTSTETILTGHDSSYLETSRERSLTESLRCLSARRPIRSGDIRTRVLSKNAQERCDLNSYTSVVEQLRNSSSLKRKGRSTTPDGVKKFKVDNDTTAKSNSSLFSSPLATLRSRFSINSRTADIASSTPKLLVYKDNRSDLHGEDGDYENVHGDDEKKSWCSIM